MKIKTLFNIVTLFFCQAGAVWAQQACYKRTEYLSQEQMSNMSSLLNKLDYCGNKNYKTSTDVKLLDSANGDKVYRIRYTHPSVNKGKAVYLFLPLNANLKNLSVNTYFHGDGFSEHYSLNLQSKSSYNLGNKISNLLHQNPNQVYIAPVSNEPGKYSDRLQSNEPQAFSKIISASLNIINDLRRNSSAKSRCIDPENQNFLRNYKTGNLLSNAPIVVKNVTHNFHSAGGWALSNALKYNDLAGDKINLLDANYTMKPLHKETPLEILMKYCDSFIVKPTICRKDNINVWYTNHGCNLSRESIIKYQNNINAYYFNKGSSPHDLLPLEQLGSTNTMINRMYQVNPVPKCR